jgi:hypothetical protein
MSKILQLPNIGNGGRLGNHLFTIASTIGLALRHGYTPRFPADWKYREHFNIPDEWFGEIVNVFSVKEKSYEHCKDLEYNVSICAGVLSISGYLQSAKYWEGYEAEIRKYLTPKGCTPGIHDAVAIHYRRTDYVGNKNYKQLSMAYYLQQYGNFFDGGTPIVAFSDDVDFIKLHHAGHWSHDDDPITELSNMASYKYHITANSTFSWWGAYLSGGNAIAPDTWFDGPLLKTCSVKTLFPAHWWKMVDGKVDLKDCTFIIPVMVDHQDRVDNLTLVLRFLHEHFDTNIIIGEINTTKLLGAKQYQYRGFHRTRCLNEMTVAATTKYVINWDADVIIPPFQILQMVYTLRNGSDVVYPYDGTFAGVPRSYFANVVTDLNLPALRGEHWRGFGEERFKSVGGAVGYDKEAFLKAGGENENFVSYAPEDQERYWRFNLLGMQVERIKGPLYHMDHYRGPDSTMNNPDSRASHKYWDSIKHFNKEQIIEHLKLDWK